MAAIESSDLTLQESSKQHKYLYQRSKLPVAVFDTCVHRGNTMNKVTGYLKGAGFKDIHACIVSPDIPEKAKGVKYASMLRREPDLGCTPFATLFAVTKDSGLVSHKRQDFSFPPGHVMRLRNDISGVFRGLERPQ